MKRISIFFIIICLWAALFPMPGQSDPEQPNPLILDAFESVSIDEITVDARILTGETEYDGEFIVSRDIYHPHHALALEYLEIRLEGLGFSVWVEEFYCAAQAECSNLIVEIPGTKNPDAIWIVGAHFDSTNGSDPGEPAAGAVDNASGVIIVLQTLAALRDYSYNDTIRFILFDAEEIGLVGSEFHAGEANKRGEDIRLMINLDTPGWRLGEINETFSSSDIPSWPDLQLMNLIAPRYPTGTNHVGVPMPSNDSSDMGPFWDEGYHGFMIGSLFALTGWMNTGLDTFEKLDLEQCANVSRLVIAYLGERAIIGSALTTDDDDDNDNLNDDDDDDQSDDDIDAGNGNSENDESCCG